VKDPEDCVVPFRDASDSLRSKLVPIKPACRGTLFRRCGGPQTLQSDVSAVMASDKNQVVRTSGVSHRHKSDVHRTCVSHPWWSEGNADTGVNERKQGMEMMRFLSYIRGKAGISAGRDIDLRQTGVNGGRKQEKRFSCQVFKSYRASRCKYVSAWKDCDKRRRNKDLTLQSSIWTGPERSPMSMRLSRRAVIWTERFIVCKQSSTSEYLRL
jgi:hypothetical protein